MPVAIKLLPPFLARSDRAVEDLRRETRMALGLTHPNICRLYSFQTSEDIKYIVMEYVAGQDLEQLLLGRGNMALTEALPVLAQIGAGLDHAHSHNILHRDIKPSNIIVADDGTAKLVDFGVAREMKDSVTRLTGKGTSGTLLYMAPEQISGGQAQARSDIYSFAASLYQCLAGHPPFYRGGIEYQVMNEPPQPLAELTDSQNEVLLRALAKNPQDRQASARQMLIELGVSADKLQWHVPVPDSESENIPPVLSRKNSWLKQAAWLVATALMIIGIGILVVSRRPRSFKNPARNATPNRTETAPARQTDIPAIIIEPAKPKPSAAVMPPEEAAAEHVDNDGVELAEHQSQPTPDNPLIDSASVPQPPRRTAEPEIKQSRTLERKETIDLLVPGQYATITQAIEAAQPGQTIVISPGTYTETIVFKEGIHLSGAEKETVTIRCPPGSPAAIVASSCASGIISGITLENPSPGRTVNRGAGILLTNSTLEVFNCCIQRCSGDGIVIKGVGASVVRNSIVRENEGHGIAVSGQECTPSLNANLCASNRLAGIAIADGAAGEVRLNTCQQNGESGIHLRGVGTCPVVSENACRQNKLHGICCTGGAAGELSSNQCVENGWQGIAVFDEGTAPTVTKNTCRANKQHGICLGKGAHGIIQHNLCVYNFSNGIAIFQTGTHPTVSRNICQRNERHGIYFGDGAGGVAENNTCDDNGWSGIAASDVATSPTLRKNKCNNNANWGITFLNGARPRVISNNAASGNGRGQIMQ